MHAAAILGESGPSDNSGLIRPAKLGAVRKSRINLERICAVTAARPPGGPVAVPA